MPCDANDPILLAKAILTPQVAPLPLEVNTPEGEIEHIVSYQLEKINGHQRHDDRISVAYQVHCVCTESTALALFLSSLSALLYTLTICAGEAFWV